jgi:hypothetical protein
MPFQPGKSGNPNGRPAVQRDFRARCQQFMAKSGWDALEEMANDKRSPHRYRAVALLAAYAHGHPTQPIAGDADPDMPPVQVTVTFDRNADAEQTPA